MRAIYLVALGTLFGLACGVARYKKTEPVERTSEACCTQSDPELKNFKGCRTTGRCKKGEPFWMRGAVTCTAVDEANCDGGRCCNYKPRYGSDEGAPMPEPEPLPDAEPEPDSGPAPGPGAEDDIPPEPEPPSEG